MPGQVTAHTPLKDHRKWIAQECFIPGGKFCFCPSHPILPVLHWPAFGLFHGCKCKQDRRLMGL